MSYLNQVKPVADAGRGTAGVLFETPGRILSPEMFYIDFLLETVQDMRGRPK